MHHYKRFDERAFTASTRRLAGLNTNKIVLDSVCELGEMSGKLQLDVFATVKRELPADSVIRTKFRPILRAHRKAKWGKEKENTGKEGDESHHLDAIAIKKRLVEIKDGVRGILTNGETGKSGTSSVSFQRGIDRALDAIDNKLREVKDQMGRDTKAMIATEAEHAERNKEATYDIHALVEKSLELCRKHADTLEEVERNASRTRQKLHESLQQSIQDKVESLQRELSEARQHSQNEIMSALRQSLEKENILLASVRAVCLSLQASYAEISKSMSSMFGKRLDLVDQRLAHLQEKIESLGKENNKAQQTMETSILAILEPLRQ